VIATITSEILSPVTRRRWSSGLDYARRHTVDVLPVDLNRSNRAVHTMHVLRAEFCRRSILRILPAATDYLRD
jgi:hypothetical protein